METFNPPLFQTWLMFLGMSFALPAHYLSEWYRHKKAETDPATAAELAKENKVTARTYMLLGIPSLFDLLATCLMVFGLLHINASIWMLLRGGGATRAMFSARAKFGARSSARNSPTPAPRTHRHRLRRDHEALCPQGSPQAVRAKEASRTPWRLTRTAPSPTSRSSVDYRYMWLGVGGITVAVILVGLSSQIGVDASTDKAAAIDAADAVVGVVLTVAGTFVQSVQVMGRQYHDHRHLRLRRHRHLHVHRHLHLHLHRHLHLHLHLHRHRHRHLHLHRHLLHLTSSTIPPQYTYEEKVMSGDVSAPPWLLIGVEGVTGTAVCTVLLYPLCWILPGNDHGSFEDPLNTAAKLYNSPTALAFALLFCALVFILNSFSVLVTYMMSSVWHAILDNFRPITIWVKAAATAPPPAAALRGTASECMSMARPGRRAHPLLHPARLGLRRGVDGGLVAPALRHGTPPRVHRRVQRLAQGEWPPALLPPISPRCCRRPHHATPDLTLTPHADAPCPSHIDRSPAFTPPTSSATTR